ATSLEAVHVRSAVPRPPPCTASRYTTLFRSQLERVPPGEQIARAGQPGGQIAHPADRVLAGALAHRAVGEPEGPHVVAEGIVPRSEEHTSELQSRFDLVCRLLLDKKKNTRRH